MFKLSFKNKYLKELHKKILQNVQPAQGRFSRSTEMTRTLLRHSTTARQ